MYIITQVGDLHKAFLSMNHEILSSLLIDGFIKGELNVCHKNVTLVCRLAPKHPNKLYPQWFLEKILQGVDSTKDNRKYCVSLNLSLGLHELLVIYKRLPPYVFFYCPTFEFLGSFVCWNKLNKIVDSTYMSVWIFSLELVLYRHTSMNVIIFIRFLIYLLQFFDISATS